MRVCFSFLISGLAIVAMPVYAQPSMQHDANHNHEHVVHEHLVEPVNQDSPDEAPCEDQITLHVNGLVCDFCARAIEKVFSQREEIGAVQVDLDKGVIHLATKSGQSIDDKTLNQLVTDSGYNLTSVEYGCPVQ